MNNKIVVCLGKGGQRDQAESFARRTDAPIQDKPGDYLTVRFDSKGVSLSGFGLTYQGNFVESMLHRVTNGRLQHEMLVKAAKSDKEGRKAIDATAGMGEDAFLLAAQGYEVTLYEQNPVIAALLKDAIRRAKKNIDLKLSGVKSSGKMVGLFLSIQILQILRIGNNYYVKGKQR